MNKALAASAVLCALESKALSALSASPLAAKLPAATPLLLSPLYAGVLLVNLVAASYTLIVLGMRVGKARACSLAAGAQRTLTLRACASVARAILCRNATCA